MRQHFVTAMAFALGLAMFATGGTAQAEKGKFTFDLVPSPGIVQSGCLPYAGGTVTITPDKYNPNENMLVQVYGLPPKTGFDVFVIQVPDFPFGLSWYQGDLETNAYGWGHVRFKGRFNEETFIVGLPERDPAKKTPAPVTHDGNPSDKEGQDASVSEAQPLPVHTYHVGIWFNAPEDALAAHCTSTLVITPFNGEHRAGVQVLKTNPVTDNNGQVLTDKFGTPLGPLGVVEFN